MPIRIAAKLKDQTVQLLLDTGSSATVVRPSVAKRLGLRCEGTAGNAQTPGGSVAVTRCEPATLELTKEKTLTKFVAGTSDLPQLDAKLDGILGTDALKHYVLFVDFVDGGVSLNDRSEPLPTTGAVPLQTGPGGSLLISAEFATASQTRGHALFMIDTGSEFDVSLPAEHEQALSGLPHKTIPGRAVGSAGDIPLYVLPMFAIAGNEHADALAAILPPGYKYGLIGLGVLDNYVMLLDLTGAKVWFKLKAK